MLRTIAVVTLLALATGCGRGDGKAADASPSADPPVTVAGSLELNDRDAAENDCEGSGGYSDIAEGAQVTVRDATGRIVGTSRLGAGDADTWGASCRYMIDPVQVPPSEFYSVEVSHRGQVTVPRSEAGSVELTLG